MSKPIKSQARRAREDLAWAVREFMNDRGVALAMRGHPDREFARKFGAYARKSWAVLQRHLAGGARS